MGSANGTSVAQPLPPRDRGKLRITELEVFVVRVTLRTNWIIVRLKTDSGLSGLGEASLGRMSELPELETFFRLVRDQSPFSIELYRKRGWAPRPPSARSNRHSGISSARLSTPRSTSFSAVR